MKKYVLLGLVLFTVGITIWFFYDIIFPTKFTICSEAGSRTERIEFIQRVIRKSGAVPSAIKDIHYLEEQKGDGDLGPSDFYFFVRIEIDPANAEKWRKAMKRPPLFEEYAQPRNTTAWWVSGKAFHDLILYRTEDLFGRNLGWIGMSADGSTIYVYTFTA